MFLDLAMISMYEATITPLKRALKNLSNILKEGEAYADKNQIEHSVLLNSRLYPDMYPLTRQVQIATDMSKGAAARLANLENPKFEDTENSFAELQTRITKTLEFIESVTPKQLEGSESREITITIRKVDLKFTGEEYLLYWVNPNVYFHVTTSYNILRHNGTPLGKADFLGPRK
jgi:uncharacterized protein